MLVESPSAVACKKGWGGNTSSMRDRPLRNQGHRVGTTAAFVCASRDPGHGQRRESGMSAL
jgi:hypothetical protein